MIALESTAFDEAVCAFNTSARRPASTASADASTQGVVVMTIESSTQAMRSNIQTGISSHRVESEPLSVQRKTI